MSLTGAIDRREFAAEESWREELRGLFQDMVPESLPGASGDGICPSGLVSGHLLGDVGVYMVAGSPQIMRRTTSAICGEPGDLIKVCVQMAGLATVQQAGREVTVKPGALMAYDAGRPYAIKLEGAWTCAVIAMPRTTIGLPGRTVESALYRTFAAEHGPGMVLTDYINSAVGAGSTAGDVAAAKLGEAGAVLLAATLAENLYALSGEATDELRDHVVRYIQAHLSDSRLSRASIASAHHISARTLDRLFAGQQLSVSELIRLKRLEAVRRDIRDPMLAHLNVSTLAAKWCFFNAAHFSRLFRNHFGYPPSQCRPRPIS